MPLYSNSSFGPPYKQVLRLQTGVQPQYLFGARDPHEDPWLFSIDHVSLTSNVATITGTIRSGGGPSPLNLPTVGAKMGVRGTTSNSGAFNVDPATVTAVTFTASTGAVSVSFALTHANVSSTADTGDLVIQSYESPDLVDAAPTSSIPAALIFSPDESDNSRCVFAEVVWKGTLPTSATVVLQVANVDDNSRYQTIGTVSTVSLGAVTQSGAEFTFLMGKFLRMQVSAITGGDGTTGLVATVFA